MVVVEKDLPWKHLVIDNFLEPDAFSYVQSYAEERCQLYCKGKYKAIIEIHTKESNSNLYQIISPLILQLKEQYLNSLNYSNKVIPDKVYTHVELCICPPGFKDPEIHTDATPFKLMTSILYVSPEHSDATILYSDRSKRNKLEWKKNRALCFVGQNDDKYQRTWHSYENTTQEPRVTVNMILSSYENAKLPVINGQMYRKY
jgi:hypothetical protein